MRFKILILLFSCLSLWAKGQDTLRISKSEADSLFMQKNYLRLAAQYQVSAAEALIIQARLLQNPVISGEFNAYNPNRTEAFDIGKNGQKAVAIQQLILLGGKRKINTQLAQSNHRAAMLELEDLTRNLLLQLNQSYYSVLFTSNTLSAYRKQITFLEGTVVTYREQVKKGNIPMSEQLRLESALYNLKNDKNELANQIRRDQELLQTLLSTDAVVLPIETIHPVLPVVLDFTSYQKAALENRPDLKLALENITFAEANYRLQKALAVPDATVGLSYDQRGGAFNNQLNLTFGLPIPVFNQNQGNISAAEQQKKVADAMLNELKNRVTNEVFSAYYSFTASNKEYESINSSYLTDFESFNNGLNQNFQKRNITVLEFLDLFESYNQSIQAINDLNKKRFQLYEELIYSCGKAI